MRDAATSDATTDDTAGTTAEISKKELLAVTGISYGQLYRWKREELIPEEWFIKRSAFTGQETFLPRERVLERIKRIQSLKDDLSLSEIRERLQATSGEYDLRGALVADGFSDEFLDCLGLDLEQAFLSEHSIGAVTALYRALQRTGAHTEVSSTLIAATIEALDISNRDTGQSVNASAEDIPASSAQSSEDSGADRTDTADTTKGKE